MSIFKNEVYEQQRINIENLAKKYPDNWFYKSQMEKPAGKRTGFAPNDGICWNCHKSILEGDKAITLEDLGNYIITGCPYCSRSYCD